MNFHNPLHITTADSDQILAYLLARQHLNPHKLLGEVLDAAGSAFSWCPNAARTAVDWLSLNTDQAVGRLRKTELIQLSRSIHRFWLQAIGEHESVSCPQ